MLEPPPLVAADGGSLRPPNKTLSHALRVLDLFADRALMFGVTEIAKNVGLDKSTVSRIVATLAQHGYLERCEDGRRRT
jgi:IclR family KDG regulon transcriptional repressor